MRGIADNKSFVCSSDGASLLFFIGSGEMILFSVSVQR